jgi:hypothetical protein
MKTITGLIIILTILIVILGMIAAVSPLYAQDRIIFDRNNVEVGYIIGNKLLDDNFFLIGVVNNKDELMNHECERNGFIWGDTVLDKHGTRIGYVKELW